MTRSKIAVFKKAVRFEKYNHNHDERGRFCSGDNTKAYPPDKCEKYENKLVDRVSEAKEKNLYPGKSDVQIRNAIIDADNKEFEKIRTNAYDQIDEVAKDKRLNIDTEEARAAIDREFEEAITTLKHKPKAVEKLVSIEADIIKSDAIRAYAEKAGIASIIINDKMDLSATIDYIEGVSWAKENIGFDCDILSLTGEDMGEHVMGATYTSDMMEATMRANTQFFGKDRKVDTERNNGINVRNQSAQSVGVHETGHVIEGDIATLARSGNVDDAYCVFTEHTVAKEIVRRAHRMVGGDLEARVAEVSEYANKNESETFCECLADCYANGDDAMPLSKAVLKVIKEEREDIIEKFSQGSIWDFITPVNERR